MRGAILPIILLLLFQLLAHVQAAVNNKTDEIIGEKILNPTVFIDMVQQNPGDPVAWQQTKFSDPRILTNLGYTGQSTTGQMSGTLAASFSSLGRDFFTGPSKQWREAYEAGVRSFVQRAHAQHMDPYFHVDLLVFPKAVLDVFVNATNAKTGKVEWNQSTKQLTRVLIQETVSLFPQVKGWIVRTGETYTFDTPYHRGNSPTNGTMERWVEFISFLRRELCVRHHKQLFVRAWDNWPAQGDYYQNMTDQIPTHPLLYFSIKHTPGDFVRPSAWNPTLGIGKHAQVVEVELQREYEGKQAYPNYVMDGIIDGFVEDKATTPVGLTSLLHKPQFKGIWTWSRGGGWWGPYLHGTEEWVELHIRVLALWFTSNLGEQSTTTISDSNSISLTEPEAFQQVCATLLSGCTKANGCCATLRNVTQSAALSVLHGQWGTVGTRAFLWMRDDRMGGMHLTRNHWKSVVSSSGLFPASLHEKAWARANFEALKQRWEAKMAPFLLDPMQRDRLQATVEYGVHLYRIVDASWRAMAQGYLKEHNTTTTIPFDAKALGKAIADYDAAWAGYRAFGLANVFAPSLYHPYFLCLGTRCNCAFEPLDPGDQGMGGGIGDTIDHLRRYIPPIGQAQQE